MVNEKSKFMKEPEKIKSVRSEGFREITQDRLVGGIKEGYFVYVIQSERFDTTLGSNNIEGSGAELVDEVQVKLTPQQARRTYEWFGKLLKQYEKIFGEIKLIEKIADDKPDKVEVS